MKGLQPDKLSEAREKLKERFPFEKIKEIPKYRDFTMDQYLHLIERLEVIAILLLESCMLD